MMAEKAGTFWTTDNFCVLPKIPKIWSHNLFLPFLPLAHSVVFSVNLFAHYLKPFLYNALGQESMKCVTLTKIKVVSHQS